MGSLLSERVAVVGIIDPDAYSTGTTGTGWIDMTMYDQVMVVAMAGTLGTAAGLECDIEQATDSSGTGAKALDPAKNITELVKASNDDDQAIINVRAIELDQDNDFTHVRAVISVNTATSDAGVIVLGSRARYQPANDNDLASVQEIVA